MDWFAPTGGLVNSYPEAIDRLRCDWPKMEASISARSYSEQRGECSLVVERASFRAGRRGLEVGWGGSSGSGPDPELGPNKQWYYRWKAEAQGRLKWTGGFPSQSLLQSVD